MNDTALTFGPIPSRRLGASSGVNNIPPKHCTYSCVYCQVGRTSRMETDRRDFYAPGTTVREVENRLQTARNQGVSVDYIAIVPDGEPAPDKRLGSLIVQLKRLGKPVAVITNASLLWMEEVRADLFRADWISLKVDAAGESAWRKTDRPSGRLNLDKIHQGMETFKRGFQGVLVTETMLVSGINDDPAAIRRTADLLRGIEPSTAYISVSTRPPAETWVRAPSEETLHGAYQQFREHLDRVELLIGYEGDEFTPLGEGIKVLLGIIAVHPMREDAVFSFLTRAGADRVELQELLDNKRIKKVKHGEHWFYLRRFHP